MGNDLAPRKPANAKDAGDGGNDNIVFDWFTPEYREGLAPNAGAGFELIAWGHAHGRICSVTQQTSQGSAPHVMSKVGLEILAHTNESAIGKVITELYAGSRESPKYMQDRLEALLRAAAVTGTPGKGIDVKRDLIGREVDFSIFWDLGKPTIDRKTGRERRYVNSRVCHERPHGSPAPANFNPEIESRVAAKFREDEKSGGFATPTGEDAPWSPEQSAGGGTVDETPQWLDENEAPDMVHEFRARIQAKMPDAQQIIAQLTEAGWNPEGPIDVARLSAEMKAKMAPAGATTAANPLAPQNGQGGGVRRTGTRTPRVTQ